MSGLCGWFGYAAATADNRQLVERMAGALTRFDASSIEALSGGKGALAVAANSESAHVYQKGGLLVAVWGQVGFKDARLAHLAQTEGVAKTLAEGWMDKGAPVFADLSGAFSLCILDERAGEAILAIDRMGTRPLSYQISGESLIFGSSADALALHPLTRAEIDPQGLYMSCWKDVMAAILLVPASFARQWGSPNLRMAPILRINTAAFGSKSV